jgi:threonine aldolase
MDYINKVRQLANKHNLRMHLDGARALNAAQFLKVQPAEMVKAFDTVNFCLSKGMGCPVGSMVIGSREDVEFARMLRKMLGGQMRQIGILAICGLISLEDWQERIQRDHDNSKWLANEMGNLHSSFIEVPSADKIETNIFRFSINRGFLDKHGLEHDTFCKLLREEHKVLINPAFDNQSIRVVTHRDAPREKLEKFVQALRKIKG